MRRWTLFHGDCIERMRELDAESVHAVVTDPPYGLSFMGKAWDYDVPKAEVWRECLRVLKPGGHLLSFFGSRTYHRGVVQIEDAGFEVRDSLVWMYGTGFPKSKDVSKAIDDAAGAERGPGTLASYPGREGWNSIHGTPRKRGGTPEKQHLKRLVTAPATPEAAQWEGWGTALKPAHEPVCMARKPLIGTVAANVLAHGTGGLNVDGCRIGVAEGEPNRRNTPSAATPGIFGVTGHAGTLQQGRWPANVLLDEEAAAMLDEQSGELKSGAWNGNRNTPKTKNTFGVFAGDSSRETPRDASSGGASRFFYTAKAPRDERDAGLELLEPASGGEATDRKNGSAGLSSPRAGAGRTGGARNTHPTVKPVDLMRWLVRLVTPPGGLVLDPFAGSGSTGVACLHEGFRFLGVELEEAYLRIARERLTAWAEVHQNHTTIQARAAGQLALFGATP